MKNSKKMYNATKDQGSNMLLKETIVWRGIYILVFYVYSFNL